MTTLREFQIIQQKISKRIRRLDTVACTLFCAAVVIIVFSYIVYLVGIVGAQKFESGVLCGLGVLGVGSLLVGWGGYLAALRPKYVISPDGVSEIPETIILHSSSSLFAPFLIKLSSHHLDIHNDLLLGDDSYFAPIELSDGYIRVPWSSIEIFSIRDSRSRYSSRGSVRQFYVELKDGQGIGIFRERRGGAIFSGQEIQLVELINRKVMCEIKDELL